MEELRENFKKRVRKYNKEPSRLKKIQKLN